MTRWGEEPRLAEREPRVRRWPAVLKRRKPRVEHPCGPMQRWWDAGSFVRRGRAKVQAEWSLTVLASTLRRVLHIVGMPRLMAALGGVGRVLGRAASADGQEALWSDRWPARHPMLGLCASLDGWVA
jgi:hypothetical protein